MKNPVAIDLYHITDVANLPNIVAAGALLSDLALGSVEHEVIGYGHIKQRRMTEYRVPCCGGRFVGEFVPFYYCPRSPMLFTINKGNSGRPAGCQRDIVHLVCTVQDALDLEQPWAISDGNAGAAHTTFSSSLDAFDALNWAAIETNSWAGMTHQKQAEFLVADRLPWTAIRTIACHNTNTARRVKELIRTTPHQPVIMVKPDWYYP